MRTRWVLAGALFAAASAASFALRRPDHFSDLQPYVSEEIVQYYEWPNPRFSLSNDPPRPVKVRTLVLGKIDRKSLHELLRRNLELEGGWDVPYLAAKPFGPEGIGYYETMNEMFLASKIGNPTQDFTHWITAETEEDEERAVFACSFGATPSLDEVPKPCVREFRPMTTLETWILRVKHLGRSPFSDPYK